MTLRKAIRAWWRRYLCRTERHEWLTLFGSARSQCCMFCGKRREMTIYGWTRAYVPSPAGPCTVKGHENG